MRKFDYSFLDNGLLPANLLNLTTSIAELKTMAGLRKDEYKQIFTELEAVAKIQSIKSSNAIEGIVTSDQRIAEIVNQNSAPLNHNEAEIIGYRDALNEIHLGHEYIDLRSDDILRSVIRSAIKTFVFLRAPFIFGSVAGPILPLKNPFIASRVLNSRSTSGFS